jgi:chemotaxis protein methyltransferase CheR
MNTVEFDFIREQVKNAAGMTFAPDKAYLVESRLNAVVQKLSFSSVSELVSELRRNFQKRHLDAVVDALTINETSFMRDSRPFNVFRNFVIPQTLTENAVSRSLRVWCAAASTGQEPYSVAIALAEERGMLGGFNCQIVATDIARSALDKAERAQYSVFEVDRGLLEPLRSRYFDFKDPYWVAKPSLRTAVSFSAHNLMEDSARLGHFDVVFCRNVLIYFDIPTKRLVLDQIARRLRPNGFLFLGAAETIIGITDKFQIVPGHSGLYQAARKEGLAGIRAAAQTIAA